MIIHSWLSEGFDRTGAGRVTRAQMSQELAKAINVGLFFYEQDLLSDDEDEESWINCAGSSASENERTNVNIISQEDFAKIRPSKKDANTPHQRAPAPPPIKTKDSAKGSTKSDVGVAAKTNKMLDRDLQDMEFQVNKLCQTCNFIQD